MNVPVGHSKWTHREKGGEYTFLTVALGTGADHGVEFAYYLGADKATGMLQAFVRRLDEWHAAMMPHPTAENPYEARLAELQGEADDNDLDELI